MPGNVFDNFIAIEGGDGSGKGTHTELLKAYAIEKLGLDVKQWSFPRYGKPSAEIAGKYLDGQYGGLNEISPDLASLAYAVDRYDASHEIQKHLKTKNSLGISDRYVGSNLAHQGAKYDNKEERIAYYERFKNIEFNILDIPRPRISIVLIMPTVLAQLNVDKKNAASRSYTKKKRDIHEADSSHLEKAKANYEELCILYPEEFIAITCTTPEGNMRPIEDIQNEIRAIAKLN